MHCDRSPRFFFFGFVSLFLFFKYGGTILFIYFSLFSRTTRTCCGADAICGFFLALFFLILLSFPTQFVCAFPPVSFIFFSLSVPRICMFGGWEKKGLRTNPSPAKKKKKEPNSGQWRSLMDGRSDLLSIPFFILCLFFGRGGGPVLFDLYIFFLSGLKGAEGVVGGGPSWSFPSSTRSTRINQPTDPIKNCRCLRGQSTASNGGPSKRTSTDEKRNRMMRAGKKERKKERKKNNLRRGKAERVFPLSISVRLTATQTHTYKKKANK